ncbi:hypothetical protein GR183_17150 [Stappia sp. GBMRC 2046]|uniref:HTH marR-type domain-containing protein n=1 Tax=Stappia sediminis TaxID=2692190 RepID=A0A7X3S9A1_9HYPH|nr:MarR family transcriptional regulator [Stappia sediminis]MXN66647.1 hypothetical protein [Stappia sediminis]
MTEAATSRAPADLDCGILNDLVGHLLRHAFLRGQQVFSAVFADEDITPLQFMVLELVSRNEGVTHREVSAAMSTSASVLTTALKPLVDRKILLRAPVRGDARKVGYSLSSEGADWFFSIRERIHMAEAELMSPLDDDLRASLHRALLQLVGRKS